MNKDSIWDRIREVEQVGTGGMSAGRGPRRGGPAGGSASPGLSSSHIWPQTAHEPESATVEYAAGGTYCKVSIPTGQMSGGGPRGKVCGFSAASRRNLLKKLNCLDRRELDVSKLLFVTLTYPAEFPSAKASKRDLQAFRKRFERAWGRFAIVWKLELQKRGAPHFHLLVLMQGTFDIDALRLWVSKAWYEAVGSGDEKHLRAGTQVKMVDSWNGVMAYAAKYLGKVVDGIEDADCEASGRWWGVWNWSSAPRSICLRDLPAHVAAVLRRACVRWFEHQPDVRRVGGRIHCRVQWENAAGSAGSGFFPEDLIEEMRNFGMKVHQCHKRWRGRQSRAVREFSKVFGWRWRYRPMGCSMFVPYEVIKRLLRWAGGFDGWRPLECRS